MKRPAYLASLISMTLLSACANTPKEPPEPTLAAVEPIVEVPLHHNGQLIFDLASGLYNCEMGLSVSIHRGTFDGDPIHVGWSGGEYQLNRDASFSGLPRFEDTTSGLVWIDLPWKGVLLDGKTQKPLANECKAA